MKKLLNFIKNLICSICFFGEIILLIPIAEIIFKNQDLGMLILYFIGCEFVLHICGEPFFTKIVAEILNRNNKND